MTVNVPFDWSRHPGFDAWDRLPQQTRDAVSAAGRQDWQVVFDDILSFNKSWRPVRPVLVEQSKYDALNAITDRLLQLLLETAQRRGSTAGDLRKLLGVPDGVIEYLNDDEVIDERLTVSGRPDVLFVGGVPKFVEFNIGSEVGSVWDSERVADRCLEMFRRHGLTELITVRTPPSPIHGRYQAIIDFFGLQPGDRLTMVVRLDGKFPGSDDVPAILRSLDPFVAMGREHGLDMAVLPIRWLELDEQGRLMYKDRHVDSIFRIYVCSNMPQSPGQAAMKAAVEAGTSRVFTPSASWVLGNKTVLTWLWDDLDLLAPQDQDLVRTHVPRSRVVTAGLVEDAVRRRTELVLKPADDFGGAGVMVGHESEAEAWRAGLDEAVRRGDFVLQDYVRPDRLEVEFVHVETGELLQTQVPYSVGPYTFGRKPFGCYLRVGSHEHGEVLNLKRGIHVTGPLLIDDLP
jgi:glutathionylspermidine synthase